MAKDNKKIKKDGKEKKNNFFKDSRAELKKVTWPTAKQLAQKTSIVIVLVLVISLIVFVLDTVFEKGYQFVMEKAGKQTTQVEQVNSNEVEVTTEEVTGNEVTGDEGIVLSTDNPSDASVDASPEE